MFFDIPLLAGLRSSPESNQSGKPKAKHGKCARFRNSYAPCKIIPFLESAADVVVLGIKDKVIFRRSLDKTL